jgi:hypothetical protein
MFGDTEQQFLQIHIDAARNATDDFNPFHDPYKWERIHANPFAGTIALGFQLEMLAAHQLNVLREVTGESELLGKHELRFANYQFSFADVVQPEEGFRVDIKSTSNRVSGAGQLANRIALRKGRRLVILGYQRETRQPLNFPDVDFTGLGDLGAIEDRSYPHDSGYFLKRKFMNTSNAKNFLAGSLVDQHYYFDELEGRVRFPAMFPVAMLSCALLEKALQEGYDFYTRPMVYTGHDISIDRLLLEKLKSNDRLHILVQGPEPVPPAKGLGKSDIPQTRYNCFGLVDGNGLLYRAKVDMALLADVIAVRS